MTEDARNWIYLATMTWLIASSQASFTIVTVRVLRLRLPWMIRVSLVPILLSVFLLVPAVEVIWLFLIQFLTVSCIITWVDRLRARTVVHRDTESLPPVNKGRKTFSLATALFLTTVVACVVVLVRITPEQNALSISSLFLIGLTAGVVGVGTLVVFERSPMSRLRVKIAQRVVWLVVAILLCLPLAWFDWLLPVVFGSSWTGWPPDTTVFGRTSNLHYVWLCIVGIQVPLLFALIKFLNQFRGQTRSRILSVAAMLVVAVLPTYVLVHMLWPLDTRVDLPNPNAFGELVSLAKEAEQSAFAAAYNSYTDWDLVPRSVKVQSMVETEPILRRLAPILDHECKVPLTYTWADIDIEHATGIRTLARALVAKAQMEIDKDPDQACDWLIQGINLSTRVRNGGLLIHFLIGHAVGAHSCEVLVENRRYYTALRSQRAIGELLNLLDEIEPIQAVIDRDQTWERASHWTSKISLGVSQLVGVNLSVASDMTRDSSAIENAQLRMAILALAAELFQRRYLRYPNSLDELTETINLPLPLLLDPFSPSRQSFIYRLSETGYTLYSLGPNRVDDGGKHDSNDFNRLNGLATDIPLRGLTPLPAATATGGPY